MATHDAATREYRVAELAKEAGITVRTLRFYRERGLLPPPRREGRIAWYSDVHLARLRTIAALLERGHTLGGIAELISAWEDGRDVAGLLGVESALAAPWSEETEVRVPAERVEAELGLRVSGEDLAEAISVGYVRVEGDELVHVSRRLLDATLALVRAGVPLPEVLAVGRAVREHADALADLFTLLIRRHLFDAVDPSDAGSAGLLGAALDELRPLARTVIDAELGMAMDRRVRAELESWIRAHASGGGASAGAARGA